MIKSVELKNFKSIKEEKFSFTNFDLLVGRNNSGKSTVLQALAIWQFCVDEFERTLRETKKSGSDGIQIILPNFTALPVPEFNLLWTDRVDRIYKKEASGSKKQEYIYIKIKVEWLAGESNTKSLEIELHYHSSQAIYAKPTISWKEYKELRERVEFPRIIYVPPFSGLEPTEKWLADPNIREHIGKGQPGSVLRNLLYKVVDKKDENGSPIAPKNNEDWQEIEQVVKNWFSIDMLPIKSDKLVDTRIICEYKKDGVTKKFDIISGGSGFHQTLTLLAFLYGHDGVSTILLDEPDAHLHVNLQKEIMDYFKRKATARGVQFIVATHAEEFIRGVSAGSIVSVLDGKPKRIQSKPDIITALANVGNIEATSILQSPFILYVEGESDERILRAWAGVLGKEDILREFFISIMGGGSKDEMKKNADAHFNGLKLIAPRVKRLMLFDYDIDKTAFRPDPSNPSLFEWKRKNIENYLLVPDTWKEAILQKLGLKEQTLFSQDLITIVEDFFTAENLTLPPKHTWQNINADIFKIVNGKKILYENSDSLFFQLDNNNSDLKLSRDVVAGTMKQEHIHQDILDFFTKLENLLS